MMKYMMMLAATVSLSACMGDTTKVSATAQINAGPMACGNNPYMQGAPGMPVRCGAQVESPYTFQ